MNYQTKLLTSEITYTGSELRPQFVSEQLRAYGSGCVGFVGACEVPTEALVDLDDKRNERFIRAKSMLHFVEEVFDQNLELAVMRQRLMIACFAETLREKYGIDAKREGDDLFISARKLTVSIATASAVSTLIHFGVNIEDAGSPVASIGLAELNVDARALAELFLNNWQAEMQSMHQARCKVLPR